MKLGVLTSSRADYGIYKPLLSRIQKDRRFELEVIAFGMHLLPEQGLTVNAVERDGYHRVHRVGSMPEKDSVVDVSRAYGHLVTDFTEFWSLNLFDWVLALGDRWEMSAAVQSSIPFEVKIGHIHGGETTLGAIDNIYRHQITLASKLHFTAAEEFSSRVKEILGHSEGIHTVGSISLEGLKNFILPDWQKIKREFQIPFDNFVLVTFHPESVGATRNEALAKVALDVLEELVETRNLLITKANSDAMGSIYNRAFERLEADYPDKVRLVGALGKWNYFKAMDVCDFILGNSSSGIVEAASFNKWVVNVGDRQKGRLRNGNVIDVSFTLDAIQEACSRINDLPVYKGGNKYVRENSTERVIQALLAHA